MVARNKVSRKVRVAVLIIAQGVGSNRRYMTHKALAGRQEYVDRQTTATGVTR